MKTKLVKFFNLIKKDKQAKILTIMGIILLFIFTLGYSLSMFTTNQNKKIANIKVNDLSFNITTNNGESNDRILHLQAGKLEQFNIILTNLNKIDVKYEFTYELCNNQNCTETSNNIPSDISIYKEDESSEVSGTVNTSKTKSLTILTNNKSNNDYYIKLNLNAGYIWNDLELANQITNVFNNISVDIITYVDGIKVQAYPDNCNYEANIKGYVGNTEVQLHDASVTCDFSTKKWNVSYGGNVNKIVINFSSVITPGTFADDSWDKIAKFVRNGQGQAYPVGSEKEVEINGTSYTVRVANNTTPTECSRTDFSQTACGFVVEFADAVERGQMNSTSTNVGGWPAKDLHEYANGEFLNKLPAELRKVIIDTKVVSGHGSTSGETNFTSTDKIYLLSGHEVYEDGTNNQVSTYDTAYDNTRQLDYYKSKGVTTSNYSNAIKKNNGSNFAWWLRTASSLYNYSFLAVDSNGGWSDHGARSTTGFAPAFRIG